MSFLDSFKNVLKEVLRLPQKSAIITRPTSGGTPSTDFTRMVGYQDNMIISNPVIRAVFHIFQAFFSALAMACFAIIASFQTEWNVGPSALTRLALFVSVFCIFLSLFLLLVTIVYRKYNKSTSLSRTLDVLRVGFIVTGLGCPFSLIIASAASISAWTEPGCINSSDDPHASLGRDFIKGLPLQCTLKKVGSIFFWVAFGFWVASLVLLGIDLMDWRLANHTKYLQETSFTHQDLEGHQTTAYQPVGSAAPPSAPEIIIDNHHSHTSESAPQRSISDNLDPVDPQSITNNFEGHQMAAYQPVGSAAPPSSPEVIIDNNHSHTSESAPQRSTSDGLDPVDPLSIT